MAKKDKEPILEKEIKIEVINPAHTEILNNFETDINELKDFLIEDALNNQKQKISLTFLWFIKKDLAAYITLLNDKINLEGNLKAFFRDKEIFYKALPALKIGRLCVDNRFRKKGLGRKMVIFAIQRAGHINKKIAGCRFITLDAKRNQKKELDSIYFYRKLGFKVLKERKKGTAPMYLDLKMPSKD
ncbi:MAG: GNAT family N-acetyltransferase [archaeon]|nr:GNAT family N-acetyltransferase [archaeon]